MKAKTVRRTIVASIATVAGVFGGMKLYANKKKREKDALMLQEPVSEAPKKSEES